MRLALARLPVILVAAAPDAVAVPVGTRTIWFYSAADNFRWCGVDNEKAAKAAASSARFASGSSAMVRPRANEIYSATVMTQSEDAYVEDSYTFDRNWKVSTLVRRGHYDANPYFSVTYSRDAAGRLVLTAPSVQQKLQQEKAGHETYFVDWPRFRTFAQLPFATIVNTRSPAAVTRRCAAS